MVFRVEKNTNYIPMSTYHLRDGSLSMKAKGLLSLMLCLSEKKRTNLITLAELSENSRENARTIEAAMPELESAGYVMRYRVRDDGSKPAGAEYVIREYPETPSAEDNGETR